MDPPDVEPGHHEQHTQGIDIHDGKQLIADPAVALGDIDTQHVQQEQLNNAVCPDHLKEIPAEQVDGPYPVHDPEANDNGYIIGKKGQCHVADQVQYVQNPLILFDHFFLLCPPCGNVFFA